MCKMRFDVQADFLDKDISAKRVSGEEQDVTLFSANYNLEVVAEDMKKAYDIAEKRLPEGSVIRSISATYSDEPIPMYRNAARRY